MISLQTRQCGSVVQVSFTVVCCCLVDINYFLLLTAPKSSAVTIETRKEEPGKYLVECNVISLQASCNYTVIVALTRNLDHITATVAPGSSLQWFANCLVEKAFIPHGVAQGILGMYGVTPAQQAGQLLDSVFAQMRGSRDKRHWFNEFVDIFSHNRAYQDLAERLMRESKLAI